jgi:putative (di)nucleoside polyphosphate hydrolase
MSGRLYRPCVGVTLINQAGDAFIGHRKRKRGSEVLDPRSWQMPQGGIDADEQPFEAAKRELWEETNVSSAELIAELPKWLKYDLPENARGRWSGRYRGQTQKWFLFRFVGSEKEINVHHPADGAHDAEFDDWRWERFERLPELVVPFKREVYEAVAAAFAPLARPQSAASTSTSLLPICAPTKSLAYFSASAPESPFVSATQSATALLRRATALKRRSSS